MAPRAPGYRNRLPQTVPDGAGGAVAILASNSSIRPTLSAEKQLRERGEKVPRGSPGTARGAWAGRDASGLGPGKYGAAVVDGAGEYQGRGGWLPLRPLESGIGLPAGSGPVSWTSCCALTAHQGLATICGFRRRGSRQGPGRCLLTQREDS